MYKAKLISADFEESTMEFEIQHEFTVKKGEYIIIEKSEFEELSKQANLKKTCDVSEKILNLKSTHKDWLVKSYELIIQELKELGIMKNTCPTCGNYYIDDTEEEQANSNKHTNPIDAIIDSWYEVRKQNEKVNKIKEKLLEIEKERVELFDFIDSFVSNEINFTIEKKEGVWRSYIYDSELIDPEKNIKLPIRFGIGNNIPDSLINLIDNIKGYFIIINASSKENRKAFQVPNNLYYKQ